MLNEHNFRVCTSQNDGNVEEHFGEVYLILTYLYLCLKDILYFVFKFNYVSYC